MQSLLLLNSEFSLRTAQRLAGLAMGSVTDADEQIGLVFRRTLSREPTEDELLASRGYLSRQIALMHSEQRAPDELALAAPCPPDADPYAAAALTDLCLAMFNLNEFIHVD